MKARFTAWVARGSVTLGIVVMIVSAILGTAVFLVWPHVAATERVPAHEAIIVRALAAVVVAGLGFALRSLLIVRGQILLVFLDIRRRLVRLDRVARRLDRRSRPEAPPPSRQTERLRPR